MSTDPYKKNNKGLRIRQAYNQAVERMNRYYGSHGPCVRTPDMWTKGRRCQWEGYKAWWNGRHAMLDEERNELLREAEQRERSLKNARKRDHGKCRPRGH